MVLRRVCVLLACATALSGCRHTDLFADGATLVETAAIDQPGSIKDAVPVSLNGTIIVDTPHRTRLHGLHEGPRTTRDVDVLEAADQPQHRYLLDTGDRVRVFVYGQPNLSREYGLDDAGTISIPLLGPIRARGLSTQDLEALISAKLRIDYVRDPHVNVEITTYRPFFILGEVRNPGQYPYVNRMTAETAVALAGGYTGRADKRTLRIDRSMNGLTQRLRAPSYIRVRPGDTIVIGERFF